ncbi:MAG: response regulator transcription factor [Clostridiales bacterium]|nr:response regulator transcription factor [Clostridiales bacterium]
MGAWVANLCIVEDDDGTAEAIESYLKRFASEYSYAVSVKRFSGIEQFLENYDSTTDVVFMDINLPDGNGMDAVHRLREMDGRVAVVFITALAQYAVGGYSVNAFDFVVKPVTYEGFLMKLRRLFEHLSSKRKCTFVVTNRQGRWTVNSATLRYVEINRHVVIYHTESGEIIGNGTLGGVMDMLKGLPFALCNRCYLVNLAFVTNISDGEVVVGGDRLLISQPRRREFMRAFNEYLATGGLEK